MTGNDLTALILTYNEAPNIERTLRQLSWLENILVVDSYSTDETIEILRRFPQVKILQRQFDTFASQCNFGLRHITTKWALSLDADYVLTDALVAELKALEPHDSINAFNIRFRYCVFGKPLRGTLYPPRKVLYRRERAFYTDDGHAHQVKIEGETAGLSSYILHDDRKSLSRWLSSQDQYMVREAEKFRQTPPELLGWIDRIRCGKIFAPFLVLVYCLFVKKCILDGWRGWHYTLQRTLAEILLAIRLIESEQLPPHPVQTENHSLSTEDLQRRRPVSLKDSK